MKMLEREGPCRVNWIQLVPPPHRVLVRDIREVHVARARRHDLASLPDLPRVRHLQLQLVPRGRVALTPGGCQIGYMGDQNSTYGLHSLPGGVRLVTWSIPAVINRCVDPYALLGSSLPCLPRGCQIGYVDILAVINWS